MERTEDALKKVKIQMCCGLQIEIAEMNVEH